MFFQSHKRRADRDRPCRIFYLFLKASDIVRLGDFDVKLPEDIEVRVWDSTAEIRYLVIPLRPAGTDGWSEERLADLVTRDAMIGTGLVKATS